MTSAIFQRRVVSATAVLLVAAAAHAHICDNVWRQADKLIIKPETSNLVVKDKTSFKIFMQSNMDRGIAGKVQLVGRSDAFDVQVSPEAGQDVTPGKQIEYEVALTLKPGVKSGQYPLDFDAVIGGRKLRSYSLNATKEGQLQTAPSAPRGRISAGKTPVIDGSVSDECWKTAILIKPQEATTTADARPMALITADSGNIYVATSTKIAAQGAGEGAKDSVSILLAAPGSTGRYKLSISSDGSLSVSVARDGEEKTIDTGATGISGTAKIWKTAWNAELAIPLSAVNANASPAGQTWRVKVVREDGTEPGATSTWDGSTAVTFPR